MSERMNEVFKKKVFEASTDWYSHDMTTTLPPLNAIRVFETAARHENFARAAEELSVTQSAVSKQISILEDYIGGQLFERHKRGVSLTLEGRELKLSLAPAFEILASSFDRYSRRPPRSNKFRLATVASFASQFLVPRLPEFEAAFPDLELEILTSDRVLDLSREEVDLSVRYGAGGWQGEVSQQLTNGKLVPVCKPPGPILRGAEGASSNSPVRRIQVFSADEWKHWTPAPELQIDFIASKVVMEHFLVAVRAVVSGIGVALLPEVIVRDNLKRGEMVQFGASIDWAQAFHLVHRPNAQRFERTQRVMDWLHSAIER